MLVKYEVALSSKLLRLFLFQLISSLKNLNYDINFDCIVSDRFSFLLQTTENIHIILNIVKYLETKWAKTMYIANELDKF